MAFWVNAYNAFVLQDGHRTTIRSAAVAGLSGGEHPADPRRVRAHGPPPCRPGVTLDEIEKTILPEFRDPRLYLALGRGAVGSGRLRSEAYTAARLEAQLDTVRAEFVNQHAMFRIDRLTGQISVTPIISWREAEFVAAYDPGPDGTFGRRSPVERAILAFATPGLLRLEREFVDGNGFRLVFHEFDWRINDLTGGRGD
jgi:hypothetical protein